MRQLGAPAAGCFLTGHGRIALGAASFHKEIMARRGTGVQRETKWFALRWWFSCQRGEADAILKCSLPAGESRGRCISCSCNHLRKFEFLMRTPDIRPYKGKFPQIAASAYIDPAAVVIGDVEIGESPACGR